MSDQETPPPLFRPFTEVLDEHQAWAQNPLPRIPTGLAGFDQVTRGGVAPGELCLIQGRSGTGKTWVALNIIHNNLGIVPTVFFSLEMQAHMIAQRLAAIVSEVPDDVIERDVRQWGTSPAIEVLRESVDRLAVLGWTDLSFGQMDQAIEETAEAWGEPPRLVLIDYSELIGKIGKMDTQGLIEAVMKRAKGKAQKWNAAVHMLHQVGRGAGGSGHELVGANGGRYGGEQSADYIISIARPHLDPAIQHDWTTVESRKRMFDFGLMKSRGGHQGGRWRMHFEPATGRLYERGM